MHRIVHLDLKGAPLRVQYLEQVLLTAKSWGATGVLLEWEDTFPYTSELAEIGSYGGSGGDGLYSMEEVRHILRFTKDNGLEPIQLIQTIGHMEFVLKHPQFQSLREAPHSPAVLCPSKAESQMLVRAMLEQVLEVHPDAAYLHIGADEVWHTGVCAECQRRASGSEFKTASLYLDHVRELSLFLKQRRPNLTILMWDDMLRSISVDTMRVYQLGGLVEPVVWHYSPLEVFELDPNLWHTYRQLFPRVWAGSAFKGANGSCQLASPVVRYSSNHEAWIQEINKYSSSIHFAGVILTGWSRYDHYATLCELLPVALPSLASCLKLLANTDCSARNDTLTSDVLRPEEWPGEQLARNIHSFVFLRNKCFAFIHGDQITSWMNPWQVENNYTNPVQIEGLVVTSRKLITELAASQSKLSTYLQTITGRRSTDEWINTFITPIGKRLKELHDTAQDRLKVNAGVRPMRE